MAFKSLQPIKLFPGGQSIGLLNKGMDQVLAMGIITFIDPHIFKYGAVGHVMPHFKGRQLKNSCMISSAVREVVRSEKGKPGNLIGDFLEKNELGTIDKNTEHGIFGRIQRIIPNPYFIQPIPVASLQEINPGPAKLYTVIDGDKVEEFEVIISATVTARKKWLDLEIEVNDPKLIQRTGGFVRGMSGSPIVQNGKLVGAFSYISGKDNLRGFGVLVETMLTNLSEARDLFPLKGFLSGFINLITGFPASVRRFLRTEVDPCNLDQLQQELMSRVRLKDNGT